MTGLVEKILKGGNVRQVLTESSSNINEKRAVDMVSDWLRNNAYGFSIDSVESLGIKVSFTEIGPEGQKSKAYFVLKPDGRLYDVDDEDVVDFNLDCYANDPSVIADIKDFEKKWY